jgi:hypothetical protein
MSSTMHITTVCNILEFNNNNDRSMMKLISGLIILFTNGQWIVKCHDACYRIQRDGKKRMSEISSAEGKIESSFD